MGQVSWSDDLSVGIDVIDTQHRRIVDYINQLHDIQDNPDRGVVGEVIENLIDYTYTHFAFEETMLEDAAYPLLDVHQKIHAQFIERIGQFKARYAAGENVAQNLCDMLAAWLFDHIREEDQAYAATVTAHRGGK